MSEIDGAAPWNTSPNTIEEMLQAINAQHAWEEEHNEKVPGWWNIILRSAVMKQMMERLIAVEAKVSK